MCAASAGPATAGREVLVVEDDPEINELVGAYAQLAGYVYRAALTGTAGIDEATRHPPAVIILDLMLPDIDGFEVCRRLKKSSHLAAHVPILILTALDKDSARQEGLACGAAAYLTKPFDPDVLMREIARVASNHS